MQSALLILAASQPIALAPGSPITRSVSCVWLQQANIPATEQRLIYKGQILKDERTVESYGEYLGSPGASDEGSGSPGSEGVPPTLNITHTPQLLTDAARSPSMQASATPMCCTWCVASPQATPRGEPVTIGCVWLVFFTQAPPMSLLACRVFRLQPCRGCLGILQRAHPWCPSAYAWTPWGELMWAAAWPASCCAAALAQWRQVPYACVPSSCKGVIHA